MIKAEHASEKCLVHAGQLAGQAGFAFGVGLAVAIEHRVLVAFLAHGLDSFIAHVQPRADAQIPVVVDEGRPLGA